MEFLTQIPEILVNFVITLLFSLLIGLEQKKMQTEKEETAPIFGTDRTFSFIGILGYVLYILEPHTLILFITGAVILALLLATFYYTKIREFHAYGSTTVIVGLITYSLGPVVITQPKWLTILIVVSVLILVERKWYFEKLTAKINIDEFLTLAKFLIIAGVILPIIPRDQPIPIINLTPYEIWVTVVVVSSISYLSYLLRKYVWREKGVIVTGLLGGMYSSTATTLVISKQSREAKAEDNHYASSIVLATSMMYVRILILMFIFNAALGMLMVPYMVVLILFSALTGGIIYLLRKPAAASEEQVSQDTNPLELKIAILFAALFVLFSVITYHTVEAYGTGGLDVLSYIVGFTDIDPFLLNLFQGKFELAPQFIGKAAMQAMAANNILKAVYAGIFADNNTKKMAIAGLAAVTIVNIVLALIIV